MTINPDFIFRKEFDNTGVLLNTVENKVFYLNAISVIIFELLQQGCDKAQILEGLGKRVRNLPPQASQDVDALLEQLKKIGALED